MDGSIPLLTLHAISEGIADSMSGGGRLPPGMSPAQGLLALAHRLAEANNAQGLARLPRHSPWRTSCYCVRRALACPPQRASSMAPLPRLPRRLPRRRVAAGPHHRVRGWKTSWVMRWTSWRTACGVWQQMGRRVGAPSSQLRLGKGAHGSMGACVDFLTVSRAERASHLGEGTLRRGC